MGNSEVSAEQAAALIIQRHLGSVVVVHDDNSRERMVDLLVGDPPGVAVEVTGVMDENWVRTWNSGPARGPIPIDAPGRWMLVLKPTTNLKRLKKELGPLIRELHQSGLDSFHLDFELRRRAPAWYDRLEQLGIDSLNCYDPADPDGIVHTTLTGFSAIVPSKGEGVCEWLEDYLASEALLDVRLKLRSSLAPRREVFLFLALSAPTNVYAYLTSVDAELPVATPTLPEPLDGVWLYAAGGGVVWRNGAWARLA